MTTKKKCGACRELGHDRSECPVLKAGRESIASRPTDSEEAKQRFSAELTKARNLADQREKERSEQRRKDEEFYAEGLRRKAASARASLIEELGQEEFDRQFAERIQRMKRRIYGEVRGALDGMGVLGDVELGGVAAVDAEDVPRFLEEFAKRGGDGNEAFDAAIAAVRGVRMDTSNSSESIDEYWARRRREKQEKDAGLN